MAKVAAIEKDSIFFQNLLNREQFEDSGVVRPTRACVEVISTSQCQVTLYGHEVITVCCLSYTRKISVTKSFTQFQLNTSGIPAVDKTQIYVLATGSLRSSFLQSE